VIPSLSLVIIGKFTPEDCVCRNRIAQNKQWTSFAKFSLVSRVNGCGAQVTGEICDFLGAAVNYVQSVLKIAARDAFPHARICVQWQSPYMIFAARRAG
jgi:hypothetical protein